MTAEEIFRGYVRQIGIGGIAMAGIIGIIRSSKIIGGAFWLAWNEIVRRKSAGAESSGADADRHPDALHRHLPPPDGAR